MFDRLTSRTDEGEAQVLGINHKIAFARLAAYEDTGLSPEEVQELAKAKGEGRLVVLPPPEESDYEGLKVKYRVYKAKDNTPVENCFVLRPEKDLAAVAALTAYAHATDNKQLAEDILNWITPDERVKVLPCKVGDTVNFITQELDIAKGRCRKVIDEYIVTEIRGNKYNSLWFMASSEKCAHRDFHPTEIGKTVFLTREEAEKALGGGEG